MKSPLEPQGPKIATLYYGFVCARCHQPAPERDHDSVFFVREGRAPVVMHAACLTDAERGGLTPEAFLANLEPFGA